MNNYCFLIKSLMIINTVFGYISLSPCCLEVTVSISAQSYEVIESVGLVDIVVMTNGVFPAIIEGTLTTLENGSASGTEYCFDMHIMPVVAAKSIYSNTQELFISYYSLMYICTVTIYYITCLCM